MNLEQEKKMVAAWSQTAMKLMDQHGVAYLPENYTLWFEYARGSNKDLKNEVEKMIKEKKPFTPEFNDQLYHNHIIHDLDNKMVAGASARVQHIMANVLKAVESSNANTASFNTELETFSQALKGSGLLAQGQLPAVIAKIVDRTKELHDKGENLNKKLSESRKEVEILKTNLDEVSMQVSVDSLTGIANRKAFDETLRKHMDDARKANKNLCLLMLDVDNFKKFNDSYGHLLGDQVLRVVAQAMREVIKGKDFVARFGGEEFVIILPNTPLRGAEIVAENIRQTIASRELDRKDDSETPSSVTVSIGVAILGAQDDKPEDLISRADKALYASKKNGRNRVTTEE